MFPIPEDHQPIPDTYKGKPLEKRYRYFNELGELVGYVGYYERVDEKREKVAIVENERSAMALSKLKYTNLTVLKQAAKQHRLMASHQHGFVKR